MTNYIQEGDVLDYVNSTGSTITAGSVVIKGSLAGIAVTDILDTETGAVLIEGVVKIAKHNGTAMAQGDEIFWSTGAGEATKTATDKPIGTAHEAAASGDLFVNVKLYGRGNGTATAAVVAVLTDNSGGASADGTIGAITTGTPADLAAQAAINTQIRDAIKELSTKVNAILTSLKDSGLMASS